MKPRAYASLCHTGAAILVSFTLGCAGQQEQSGGLAALDPIEAEAVGELAEQLGCEPLVWSAGACGLEADGDIWLAQPGATPALYVDQAGRLELTWYEQKGACDLNALDAYEQSSPGCPQQQHWGRLQDDTLAHHLRLPDGLEIYPTTRGGSRRMVAWDGAQDAAQSDAPCEPQPDLRGSGLSRSGQGWPDPVADGCGRLLWVAQADDGELKAVTLKAAGLGATTSWASPAGFPQHSVRPQTAINDRGDAMVAWTERDDDQKRTMWAATRYDGGECQPSMGLSGDEHVGDSANSPIFTLAVGADGHGTVAWFGRDDPVGHDGLRLLARHFDPDGGWQPLEVVRSWEDGSVGRGHPGMPTEPRLHVGAGGAVQLWWHEVGELRAETRAAQPVTSRIGYWAAVFDPANGWGEPLHAPAPPSTRSGPVFPLVEAFATDPEGRAVFVHRFWRDESLELVAQPYAPGSAWGEPSWLTNRPGDVGAAAAAFDASGDAVVVWEQYDSENMEDEQLIDLGPGEVDESLHRHVYAEQQLMLGRVRRAVPIEPRQLR